MIIFVSSKKFVMWKMYNDIVLKMTRWCYLRTKIYKIHSKGINLSLANICSLKSAQWIGNQSVYNFFCSQTHLTDCFTHTGSSVGNLKQQTGE